MARGHIQAFEKGRSGESYELGGPFASWLDFAQRICKLLGVPAPRHATPFEVLLPLSYVLLYASKVVNVRPPLTPDLVNLLKTTPDSDPREKSKSRDELGYESSSLDVMVEDCHRWMVKEKMI